MEKVIILLAVIGLLAGCSGEGKLKIINRTEHEIYFNIENRDYLIEGSNIAEEFNSITITLDAGKDFPNTPRKTYLLSIIGETFAIYDYDQQVDVPDTKINIEKNETTSVYCDPNYACLRITNNSDQFIQSAYYIKSYNGNQINISQAENLSPGESVYKHLEYSLKQPEEPEDNFYYIFGVVMPDTTYIEGDETTILYLDDLYELVIE